MGLSSSKTGRVSVGSTPVTQLMTILMLVKAENSLRLKKHKNAHNSILSISASTFRSKNKLVIDEGLDMQVEARVPGPGRQLASCMNWGLRGTKSGGCPG